MQLYSECWKVLLLSGISILIYEFKHLCGNEERKSCNCHWKETLNL